MSILYMSHATDTKSDKSRKSKAHVFAGNHEYVIGYRIIEILRLPRALLSANRERHEETSQHFARLFLLFSAFL